MPFYDYIIVGSGIAGLYTALLAQERGIVLVITKGSLQECNTAFAQGGIAAAVGPGDTPDMHREDTVNAGAGLNDEETTKILAYDAPGRIADLIHYGVPFDTVDGEIALGKEGAHRLPRILHAGGDATGKHIELTLAGHARSGKIILKEYSLLADIHVANGIVSGLSVFDASTGTIEEITCRNLILATGGAGQLFKLTTNSGVVTGDGVAMAYRAGAEIMDMEFFQFHPTALRLPGAPVFLVTEAIRGEGGILRDSAGRAFMKDYSPLGDLAPRDIVSRSIVSEMKSQGTDHVYLDVTHLPAKAVATHFPQIYQYCKGYGLDITQKQIPVAPAAHYMMGGVKVNSWGETNIPGLWAAGEASCTGAHGANRLASNSLLETLVFGKRLVERTTIPAAHRQPLPPSRIEELRAMPVREHDRRRYPAPTLEQLQHLMWHKVGIERNAADLQDAIGTLAAWECTLEGAAAPRGRAGYDLRNAVTASRLMAEAALYREESRGAHYRSDFPKASPAWQKHIVWTRPE